MKLIDDLLNDLADLLPIDLRGLGRATTDRFLGESFLGQKALERAADLPKFNLLCA